MRPTPKFPTTVWTGDTSASDRDAFVNYKDPNAQDWDEIASEVIAIQEALGVAIEDGTPGTGVTAAETVGVVKRTVLTINASIAMADHTTAGGHGSLKIYDFPACGTTILSVVSDFTLGASGNLAADTTVNVGLGTTAVAIDNEALSSTETDLCAVEAVTLSANVGAYGGILGAPVTFDGTATAKDMYLNLAADATGSTGAGAIGILGTVTITWINGGDN